ncbi:hypothetical protein ACIP8Z_11190 [Streptomyces sp. NPDC088553]|uniref:hypothetical protein n=1 Tax=Streptomyces sp. NPDC088553 TaxID=3365864 RepID=UPI003813E820
MPDESEVPPGPRRTLLEELLSLHRQAGNPSRRRIAEQIRKIDERTAEVSRGTVSTLLTKGEFPTWARLEAVVLALAGMATGRPRPREVALWFHSLWERTTESAPRHDVRDGRVARRRPDGLLPPDAATGTLPAAPEAHWAAAEMTKARLEFASDPSLRLVDVEATAEEITVIVNSTHPLAAAFTPREDRRPSDVSPAELREEIRRMRRAFDLLMIAWGMTTGDAPSDDVRRLLDQAQHTWSRNALTVDAWDRDDFDWSDPATWRWM